ncbi:MFS transporter, partial [Staphylococcus hominis]
DDSTKNEHGTLRRSEDTSHKSDEDSGVDEVHKPINPNSEEARVNEKIKNQQSDFIFGKGITRGKILAAMLFGMFIAILNQTLLNVALPK